MVYSSFDATKASEVPRFVSRPYRFTGFSSHPVRKQVESIGESSQSMKHAVDRLLNVYLGDGSYEHVNPEFIRGTVFDSPAAAVEAFKRVNLNMLAEDSSFNYVMRAIDLCALTSDDSRILDGEIMRSFVGRSKRRLVLKYEKTLLSNVRVSRERIASRSFSASYPSRPVDYLLHNVSYDVEWFIGKGVFDEYKVFVWIPHPYDSSLDRYEQIDLSQLIQSPCVDENVVRAAGSVSSTSMNRLFTSAFLTHDLALFGVKTYFENGGSELFGQTSFDPSRWVLDGSPISAYPELYVAAMLQAVVEGHSVFDFFEVDEVKRMLRWLDSVSGGDGSDDVAVMFMEAMLEGAAYSCGVKPLSVMGREFGSLKLVA